MTGVPVLLSVGGWIAGLTGVLHGNAVIGTLGLLAFAGVAVRLVGARWAPLAVLALALAQPELDVIRATYSEPAAQLIVFGGLAIVIDALVAGRLLPARTAKASTHRRSHADPPSSVRRQPSKAPDTPTYVTTRVVRRRSCARAGLRRPHRCRCRLACRFVPFIGWLAYHHVAGWRHLMWGVDRRPRVRRARLPRAHASLHRTRRLRPAEGRASGSCPIA